MKRFLFDQCYWRAGGKFTILSDFEKALEFDSALLHDFPDVIHLCNRAITDPDAMLPRSEYEAIVTRLILPAKRAPGAFHNYFSHCNSHVCHLETVFIPQAQDAHSVLDEVAEWALAKGEIWLKHCDYPGGRPPPVLV